MERWEPGFEEFPCGRSFVCAGGVDVDEWVACRIPGQMIYRQGQVLVQLVNGERGVRKRQRKGPFFSCFLSRPDTG